MVFGCKIRLLLASNTRRMESGADNSVSWGAGSRKTTTDLIIIFKSYYLEANRFKFAFYFFVFLWSRDWPTACSNRTICTEYICYYFFLPKTSCPHSGPIAGPIAWVQQYTTFGIFFKIAFEKRVHLAGRSCVFSTTLCVWHARRRRHEWNHKCILFTFLLDCQSNRAHSSRLHICCLRHLE